MSVNLSSYPSNYSIYFIPIFTIYHFIIIRKPRNCEVTCPGLLNESDVFGLQMIKANSMLHKKTLNDSQNAAMFKKQCMPGKGKEQPEPRATRCRGSDTTRSFSPPLLSPHTSYLHVAGSASASIPTRRPSTAFPSREGWTPSLSSGFRNPREGL